MADRAHGLYPILARAGVYDLAQSCIRSTGSRRRFFSMHVRARPSDRVLDLGCGTGNALWHLSTDDYVGIDSNPLYVTAARTRFPGRGRFHVCDVTDLRQHVTGPFDVVLALGFLHHLADELAGLVLRNAAHLLSARGRLVTHDPVLTDSQSRLARWFVEWDRGPYVRREAELIRLVQQHFQVVRPTIIERPLRIPYTEIVMECEQPVA